MKGLASLAALAVLPSGVHAAPVGYAQATGYFKKATRPSLYQPLNLLDARENTAWCSPTSDPLNEVLTFGFKGPTRIDEVRVYTGNGFDATTFTEFSRAKKFMLTGPLGGQTFTVADQRGMQAVALNPPLVGAQFKLEVLDQFPAPDPEQPVCITDIVFLSGGKPLNGSWLTQKLKYNRGQAKYLGTWFAGYDGAPDRFLSFYFDGTFRYVYEPFEAGGEKPKVISGSYDVVGSRLVLELPGKGKLTVRVRRTDNTLTLVNDELPEPLRQTFRDRL